MQPCDFQVVTLFKGSLDTPDSVGNLDNVNNVNRVDKRLRNQDLEIRIQESSHKNQDQDSPSSSQGARSPTQPWNKQKTDLEIRNGRLGLRNQD